MAMREMIPGSQSGAHGNAAVCTKGEIETLRRLADHQRKWSKHATCDRFAEKTPLRCDADTCGGSAVGHPDFTRELDDTVATCAVAPNRGYRCVLADHSDEAGTVLPVAALNASGNMIVTVTMRFSFGASIN